jgi:hypothetical protein
MNDGCVRVYGRDLNRRARKALTYSCRSGFEKHGGLGEP